MASISSPGIGSGLDVNALVQGLVQAEQKPAELRLAQRETTLQTRLSAFGALKGALVALRDSLTALGGAKLFGQIKATVSQSELFTTSASSDASLGEYRIEVLQLASAQKLLSGAFTADAAIGTGTLTLAAGGNAFEVTIDEQNQTLTAIRDRINAAPTNPGIVARVVTGDDGEHLILSQTRTGSDQAITITASGGNGGLASLAHDPLNTITANYTEQSPATDAQIRVDGVLRSSATNRIDNAVDGVDLDLLAANPGHPADLKLVPDSTGARDAIQKFVDAYNALIGTLTNLGRYDPASKTAGPLLGDSAVRALGVALRRELGAPLAGDEGNLRVLSAIGITSDKTGKLTLNQSRLEEQLKDKPAAVAALFTGEGGLIDRMAPVMSGYGGASGVMDARTRSLQDAIRGLTQDRERLDQRMENLQKRYLAQFTALDKLVGQLQSTSSFLTQQIANMNAISNSR
jgi:flagellar hook-associated protein 2